MRRPSVVAVLAAVREGVHGPVDAPQRGLVAGHERPVVEAPTIAELAE